MNAAFAAWNGRIAPLFDVSQQLWVVEMEGGRVAGERQEALKGTGPAEKALCLGRLGVDLLVCGAITQPQQALVAAQGIQVVPFVAGDLRQVIAAWARGELHRHPAFVMPGCCGRWRRGASNSGKEVFIMPGQGQGRGGGRGGGRGLVGGVGAGGGRGMGRGQGGGGGMGGRGRQGGPLAAGPQGMCVCSQCGYTEPHAVGVPCTSKQCPTCGIPLTRR